MSIATTYRVEGMTCEHCVRAVTAELGALAGVEQVDVTLGSGAVVVTSSAPLPVDDVRLAVDEAGYRLVEP